MTALRQHQDPVSTFQILSVISGPKKKKKEEKGKKQATHVFPVGLGPSRRLWGREEEERAPMRVPSFFPIAHSLFPPSFLARFPAVPHGAVASSGSNPPARRVTRGPWPVARLGRVTRPFLSILFVLFDLAITFVKRRNINATSRCAMLSNRIRPDARLQACFSRRSHPVSPPGGVHIRT